MPVWISKEILTTCGLQNAAGSSQTWADSQLPEQLIWAPGKSARQVAVALQRTAQKGGLTMAARISPQVFYLCHLLLACAAKSLIM